MPSITQSISSIINQRKATANEAKQKREYLESLASTISKLENLQQSILRQSGNNTVIAEQLRSINFSALIRIIFEEQQVWDNLCKRFERNTINIGVVGLARQGKSTFLQKVSGLTDDEIPSSDRMPCTSVQSNIYHVTGDTYGQVYFHSEESFLREVIKPYYDELGFSNPPSTLAQFRNTPLPSAPINPRHPARADSVYQHLRDEYYAHVNEYANLLQSQKRVERISKQEIKKYVSQDYDAQSNPIFFNNLAVEKVEIFCTFPETDVEKIGLVDMPGLGDTRLGDAERMIKALGEDIDFILFIRRPRQNGDFWGEGDTNLYDSAFQALKDKLPLSEWSFILLNKDGNNDKACNDLQNTRAKRGIEVKKCLIANCINPRESNQVLGEVLNYLTNNIVRLDRQYMSSCSSSLKTLQNQINSELEKAKGILEQYGDGHAEYVKLKDEFLKNLYNNIEEFRRKIRQYSNQADKNFKAQLDAAITECKNDIGIPKLEEIQTRTNQYGIDEAYFWSIQKMRPSFLKHFHTIENGLKESLGKTKSDVADVLIQLGLGGLTSDRGANFLEKIAEKLPTDLKNLKLGFQFISSFGILYKGFIQSLVWQEISQVLPSDPNIPVKTPGNGNSILDNLKNRHQQAVEICQQALDKLALSVTKVQVSMVEEFADHITRAEGVDREWDIFLGKYRSQIWTEFQELEKHNKLRQEWMSLIDEAVSINQKLGN